jgi:hypothetical protein
MGGSWGCAFPKWHWTVLSGRNRVELHGYSVGRGPSFLLWGEPGVRSFWGLGLFFPAEFCGILRVSVGRCGILRNSVECQGTSTTKSCGGTRVYRLRMEHGRELGLCFFQNDTGRYFRVETESNCMDIRRAEGQASCCGVNLAFAAFRGWGFFSAEFCGILWDAADSMGRCGFWGTLRILGESVGFRQILWDSARFREFGGGGGVRFGLWSSNGIAARVHPRGIAPLAGDGGGDRI